MARAHRHYIPGHNWHITHRCHKRELLLKFSKDRHRWLQWLYEAKKRYGLVILNYTVTSNHIHLLVYDDYKSDQNAIPKSIQLVAGRTGQEFNQRKHRNGAFWEDRYHATVIEDGEHLLRCIVYIDMNMVRAGIVSHPERWTDGGYKEIQSPRRKCILINYKVLSTLSGFDDFEQFQSTHRKWVDAAAANNDSTRESRWTQSIAVGSKSFINTLKKRMNSMAIGRDARLSGEPDCFDLREAVKSYNAHFAPKKRDIVQGNAHI